jgi:hypothetical protein
MSNSDRVDFNPPRFYSYFKLFTGLADAVFQVCEAMIKKASAAMKVIQPGSTKRRFPFWSSRSLPRENYSKGRGLCAYRVIDSERADNLPIFSMLLK